MLELQAEIKKKQDTILREVARNLSDGGLKVSLTEETETDFSGKDSQESAIELSGGVIRKIRLLNYNYGTTDTIFRFQYELLPESELPPHSDKAIDARVKLVRDNKVLGLFGGEVVDVKWAGNEVAERLNADADLSRQLFEYLKHLENPAIQIYAKSSLKVDILGPRLTASFAALTDEELSKQFIEGAVNVFAFDIYERIASHIRTTMGLN